MLCLQKSGVIPIRVNVATNLGLKYDQP